MRYLVLMNWVWIHRLPCERVTACHYYNLIVSHTFLHIFANSLDSLDERRTGKLSINSHPYAYPNVVQFGYREMVRQSQCPCTGAGRNGDETKKGNNDRISEVVGSERYLIIHAIAKWLTDYPYDSIPLYGSIINGIAGKLWNTDIYDAIRKIRMNICLRWIWWRSYLRQKN